MHGPCGKFYTLLVHMYMHICLSVVYRVRFCFMLCFIVLCCVVLCCVSACCVYVCARTRERVSASVCICIVFRCAVYWFLKRAGH